MLKLEDIVWLASAVIAAVALVFVLRWRRKTHAQYLDETARDRVCEHLKPALEKLLDGGHRVRRVGQRARDLPLEIHIVPPFDPKAMIEELKLGEPVFLSERNVLYCKEDWCEIHPVSG